MEQKIRLLQPEEIEVRVSSVSEKGVCLLLYKDARVDQKILDETFGAFGWKRSHQSIDGNLYCTVEIKDSGTGEWIAKQDVGTKGFAEQEKSQASDSFKRACFNWGIGRELYSAPFIWVSADKAQVVRKGDKLQCREQFRVEMICYSNQREICGLSICNGKGQRVFSWQQEASWQQNGQATEAGTAGKKKTGAGDGKGLSLEQVESLHKELVRTGVSMEAVSDRYHITGGPAEMSQETYAKVMQALAKTKAGAA